MIPRPHLTLIILTLLPAYGFLSLIGVATASPSSNININKKSINVKYLANKNICCKSNNNNNNDYYGNRNVVNFLAYHNHNNVKYPTNNEMDYTLHINNKITKDYTSDNYDNDQTDAESQDGVGGETYWHQDYYKMYKAFVRHAMFSDIYEPKFLIENGHLCQNTRRIFVFINSRVNSSSTRTAIRQSYLEKLKHNGINYAFLLSKPASPFSLAAILKENDLNRDLVVAGSEESYWDLTLKTAHLLDWTVTHCPSNVLYMAKVDEDVYVNVGRFLQVLAASRTTAILGKIRENCLAFRGVGASLGESLRLSPVPVVTRHHLPLQPMPPFAMGPAYVITTDLVPLLVAAAQEMVHLSYEDVFWTGLVVNELNEVGSGLNLDPDSMKRKYNSPPDRPHLNVKRVDVAGWREDIRNVNQHSGSATHAVIIHGVNWERDREFINAL